MIALSIIFLLLCLFTAFGSVALVVLPEERLSAYFVRMPWLSIVVGIIGIIVFIMFVGMTGELARGETSPLPWEAFSTGYRRHGLIEGLTSFFSMISFLLWALLVPGHLKASSIRADTGNRPSYPYVINLLIGLILVTPANPVYRIIDSVY